MIFDSVNITQLDICYDSPKLSVSTGIMSKRVEDIKIIALVSLIDSFDRQVSSCLYLPLNNLTSTGTAALLSNDHHFLICGRKTKKGR